MQARTSASQTKKGGNCHQNPAEHQKDAAHRRSPWEERNSCKGTAGEIAAEENQTHNQDISRNLGEGRVDGSSRDQGRQGEQAGGMEQEELRRRGEIAARDVGCRCGKTDAQGTGKAPKRDQQTGR
jgi:hypothetical protein